MGAEVIRIDQVGGGPDFRRWPLSPNDGASLYWEGLKFSSSTNASMKRTGFSDAAITARHWVAVAGGAAGAGRTPDRDEWRISDVPSEALCLASIEQARQQPRQYDYSHEISLLQPRQPTETTETTNRDNRDGKDVQRTLRVGQCR